MSSFCKGMSKLNMIYTLPLSGHNHNQGLYIFLPNNPFLRYLSMYKRNSVFKQSTQLLISYLTVNYSIIMLLLSLLLSSLLSIEGTTYLTVNTHMESPEISEQLEMVDLLDLGDRNRRMVKPKLDNSALLRNCY